MMASGVLYIEVDIKTLAPVSDAVTRAICNASGTFQEVLIFRNFRL